MAVAAPVVSFIAANAGMFAIAGAALSVAGLVSGNKTLGMLGGIVGLTGMAGSFANSLAGAATAAEGGLAAAEAAVDFGGDTVLGAAGQGGLNAAETAASTVAAGGDVAGAEISSYVDTVAEASSDSALNPANEVGGETIPGAIKPETPAETFRAAPSDVQKSLTESTTQLSTSPVEQLTNTSTGPDGSNIGADYGGDTILGRMGEGGLGAGPGGTKPQTWLDRILGSDFLKGDQSRAALFKVGGEAIAGGFKRDAQGEYVDLQKKRLQAEQDELARRNANVNNIGGIRMAQPNPNANLYPSGGYAVPRVGILNRARAV